MGGSVGSWWSVPCAVPTPRTFRNLQAQMRWWLVWDFRWHRNSCTLGAGRPAATCDPNALVASLGFSVAPQFLYLRRRPARRHLRPKCVGG